MKDGGAIHGRRKVCGQRTGVVGLIAGRVALGCGGVRFALRYERTASGQKNGYRQNEQESFHDGTGLR
jgi:hypothetical protein